MCYQKRHCHHSKGYAWNLFWLTFSCASPIGWQVSVFASGAQWPRSSLQSTTAPATPNCCDCLWSGIALSAHSTISHTHTHTASLPILQQWRLTGAVLYWFNHRKLGRHFRDPVAIMAWNIDRGIWGNFADYVNPLPDWWQVSLFSLGVLWNQTAVSMPS